MSKEPSLNVDVAIVGGGLGGPIAAVQLAQQGISTAVVDLHDEPRPEFRAEQLVGPQILRFDQLGLLEALTKDSRLCREAVNGRMGRFVDRTRVDQYGVPYEAMVRALRSKLPSSAQLVIGRVSNVENGPDRQRVVLSSGTEIEARLVIMTTGLSSVLPKRLNIHNRIVRAAHSLAVGFDVDIPSETPATFTPLIYYGENPRDRMDYLALFAMHDVIRANLFCYQEQQSA